MTLTQIYKTIVLLVLAVILIVFHRFIIASLLPFLLAFMLTLLIEPVVTLLERRMALPRAGAVFSMLGLLVLGMGYLTFLTFTKSVAELWDFSNRVGTYRRYVSEIVHLVTTEFVRLSENRQLPDAVVEQINRALLSVGDRLVAMAGVTVQRLLDMVSSVPGFMVILVIVVLATYFFSKDRYIFQRSILAMLPPAWRQPSEAVWERVEKDLFGYLKAQMLILLITTTVSATGLSLLKSPYWLTLSLIIGILDVIPVVGPGFIFVPWVGVNIILGNYTLSIQLSLLYGLLFAIRQISQAKIIGSSIGIHPLLMLMTLYSGVLLWGVKGILLAPVVAIIIKACWNAGLVRLPWMVQATEPHAALDAATSIPNTSPLRPSTEEVFARPQEKKSGKAAPSPNHPEQS